MSEKNEGGAPTPEATEAETLAAMDAGIAAADEGKGPEPEPVEAEAGEGDVQTGEGATGATGATGPAEGATGASGATGATGPTGPADPDSDLAGKIKDAKTRERVTSALNAAKEYAPVREALTKEGVPLAELPSIIGRHKDAQAVINAVVETGATAEDYGLALDLLRDMNAALGRGDRDAGLRALAVLQDRAGVLAKHLGVEAAGVDPLAEHPDLRDAIANGDLTPELAKEIVAKRANDKLAVTQRQATQQTSQQQQQLAQAQAAGKQAVADLQPTFAAHPRYAEIQPLLVAKVREIGTTMHPSRWEAETLKAFHLIATSLPPPAPARVPVGHVPPARGGVMPDTLAPQTFDDPMDAMDAGIASVG